MVCGIPKIGCARKLGNLISLKYIDSTIIGDTFQYGQISQELLLVLANAPYIFDSFHSLSSYSSLLSLSLIPLLCHSLKATLAISCIALSQNPRTPSHACACYLPVRFFTSSSPRLPLPQVNTQSPTRCSPSCPAQPPFAALGYRLAWCSRLPLLLLLKA